MTNAAHTPGPYRVSRHATPDYAPQYGIVSESDGRDIATVKGDNAKADASFFAAAPELFDRLCDMVARMVETAAYDEAKRGHDDGLMQLVNDSLATIAKATGD